MSETVYVDFVVLAEADNDDYLITVSKKDLNTLVSFSDELVVRSWDGDKPVPLLAYGSDAVRTQGDANEGNNLSNLPRLTMSDIFMSSS